MPSLDNEGFKQIDPPYKRPESPSYEPLPKESCLPEFLSRPDMAPQIVPSAFAGCESIQQVMAKIREGNKALFKKESGTQQPAKPGEPAKFKRTPEEIEAEGEKKNKILNQDPKDRQYKWQKRTFRRMARGDGDQGLKLSHWAKESAKRGEADERAALFDKFNCRTEVINYGPGEYESAGLDKLPSSSSWSKEETDVLMDLCQQFDLRFTVVADRFVSHLKEKYDNK